MDLSSFKTHLSKHKQLSCKTDLGRSNQADFIGIFKKCIPISHSETYEFYRKLTEITGKE